MSNWNQIRDIYLEAHPAVKKRWEAVHAHLASDGMKPKDSREGADEAVGIGPEAESVIQWRRKTGWSVDPPESDAPAAEDGGGATDVRNVRWVAENLTNPNAEARDAPSLSAWNMLVFARSSPTNTGKFWSDLYKPIMLPAKKDLETTSRDIEDEERLLSVIAQVKAIAAKAVAE